MRQEERRVEQKKLFEEHLVRQQEKRVKREERFEKARKVVVDELNSQSEAWLTTPEEVDKVLSNAHNPFIEQKLWTRPGSYIGEAAPSSDSQYWKYESHTWKMQKTYPTARQKLLEEMEEYLYDVSNVDYNVYWNKEKMDYQKELEYKARLRALVQREGKNILLMKQRQMMQDVHAKQEALNRDECLVPPILDVPVPSTDVLANYSAMEEEGIKVLRRDPTKFFVFANDGSSATAQDGHGDEVQDGTDGTTGKSANLTNLGRPIGLVDPVRDSSMTGTPYPEIIGRLPKPDMRTEREKKKQEREERMLAAANMAAKKDDDENSSNELDADAENQLSYGDGDDEDVDYQRLANEGDDIDKEWEEGLDENNPEDKELLNVPWDERYTEEDIDWVIAKLEDKLSNLKDIVAAEEGKAAAAVIASAASADDKKKLSSGEGAIENDEISDETHPENDDNDDDVLKAMGPGTVKTKRVDEKGREYMSYDAAAPDDDDSISDEDVDDFLAMLDTLDLDELIHMEDKDHVLKTLDEEQISALQSLDDDHEVNYEKTAEDVKEALSKVPGLTDAQVQSLVDLELSLAKNSEVQKQLKAKEK